MRLITMNQASYNVTALRVWRWFPTFTEKTGSENRINKMSRSYLDPF